MLKYISIETTTFDEKLNSNNLGKVFFIYYRLMLCINNITILTMHLEIRHKF